MKPMKIIELNNAGKCRELCGKGSDCLSGILLAGQDKKTLDAKMHMD